MPSPAKRKAYKKAQKTSSRPPAVAVQPQPGFVVAEQRARGTKFCCCSCGKCYDKPEDNFIKSSSPLFYGWDGYVPMCKECAELYYRGMVLPAYSKNERRAMEYMCKLFDWYWSDDIFDSALRMREDNLAKGWKSDLISMYANRRQLKQNMLRGQTYLDYEKQRWNGDVPSLTPIQENLKEAERDEAARIQRAEQMQSVPDEDVYFFGPGYTAEQYRYLREQYEDWCSRYDTQTKAQEEIFKSLCIAQLNVQRAQAEGDIKRTTDAMKTLQELMDSARIKPKQKAGDALVEQNTFGTLIQQWENEEPIPEPREEWRDVDGIGKAVTTWFFGHLAKMFHLDNDASEMYEREVAKYTVEPPRYVEDDDSDDSAFREKFNSMRGKKTVGEDDDSGGDALE